MGNIGRLYAIVGADTSEFTRKMGKLSEDLDLVGKEMTKRLTVPLLAMGAAAMKAGKDVDEAFDIIRGKTGLVGEDLEKMQNNFLNVAKVVPAGLEQVAETMVLVYQRTGLTGEALENLTKLGLRMANILGVDGKQMMEAFTGTIANWRIEADKAPAALEFLFTVAQKTGVQIDALNGLMKAGGPTLRELGFGFNEAATLIGNFTKAGINTDTILSGLKLSLRSVAKEGEPLKETFWRIVKEMQNAGSETERNTLAFKYFGRAAVDLGDAIKSNRLDLSALSSTLAGTGDSINKAYEDTRSFSEIWKEMRNRIEIALVPAGKIMLSFAETILPKVAKGLEWVSQRFEAMSPGTKALTMGLLGIVAAAGPTVAMASHLTKVVPIAAKGFASLTGVLGGLLPTLAAVVTYIAAFKLGRLIGEVQLFGKTVDQHLEASISKWIEFFGLFKGKAELVADRTRVMSKQTEMLATASRIAGRDITNLREAMGILGQEYKKTGDLGSDWLNDWAKKFTDVKINAENLESVLQSMGVKTIPMKIKSVEALKQQIELLNQGYKAGLVGPEDYKEALAVLQGQVDSLSGVTGGGGLTNLKEKLKELGVTLRETYEERLRTATEILEKYKKFLTPKEEEKLRESIKELQIQLGQLSDTFQELGLKTQPEYSKGLSELERKHRDLVVAQESGFISGEQFRKGIEGLKQQAAELSSGIVVASSGVYVLGRDFDAILPPARDLSNVLEELKKKIPLKDLPYFAGGFRDAAEAAEVLGVTLKSKLIFNLQDLENAYKAVKATGDLTREGEIESVSKIVAAYKELGLKVPAEYKKILKSSKEAAELTETEWKTTFETLAQLLTVLGDDVEGAFGNIVGAVAMAFDKMASAGKEKITDLKSALIEIGPVVLGKLGGAFGQLVSGAKKSFAGIGSAIGATVGGLLGPLGKALGGLVGGFFGGLFKKESKEEKAAKQEAKDIKYVQGALKSLGDVSEETAKKYLDLKKKFGMAKAEAMSLADWMKETGINAKNFNEYGSKMNSILLNIAKGSIDVESGIIAAGDAFSEMLNAAKELGREGDPVLVNFIKLTRELGLHVKQVDEYVYGWLEKASSGLTKMAAAIYPAGKGVEELTKLLAEQQAELAKIEVGTDQYNELQKKIAETKKQLADIPIIAKASGPALTRVSNLLLTTFNALISQGKSYSEAIAAIQEPLAVLRDKYKDLGISGGKAMEELFRIIDIKAAHAELFDAIDANREVLLALGNTGFLTQEALADLTTQAGDYYQQLIASGMSADEALRMMGPTLQDIYDYAKKYGLQIDENTLKLIEDAKAAGLLKEEQKDMADVTEKGLGRVVDKLQELIDLLSGTKKAAEDAGGGFGGWADDIDAAIGKVGELGTALGGIDAGGVGAGAGKGGEYQHGGIAWTKQWAKVGEKRPEAILSLDKFQKIVDMALGVPAMSAIRGGDYLPQTIFRGAANQGGAAGDVNVDVQIEPILIPTEKGTIIEYVVKQIKRKNIRIPVECIGG